MSSRRSAKRARQKERRAARISAIRSTVRRRRRRRLLVVGLTSVVLVAVGAALAFFAFRDESSAPTSSPAASPLPGPVAAPTPEPVACGAKLPDTAGSKKQTYTTESDEGLTKDKRYLLRMDTSCGRIDIELAVDDDPVTANSVAFLARRGFYDGLVFHRIVPGFVVQGGDPEGSGRGGPGYQSVEVVPPETKYTRGVVAMAKAGNDPPGSAGSQFFIVVADDVGLPPDYAVLGKVVDGIDVADKIVECCAGGDSPTEPPKAWVYIERATVIEE